jgi:hypothetical protein
LMRPYGGRSLGVSQESGIQDSRGGEYSGLRRSRRAKSGKREW